VLRHRAPCALVAHNLPKEPETHDFLDPRACLAMPSVPQPQVLHAYTDGRFAAN
jgi:hypothetical protein